MRFVIDAQLPPALARLIAAHGHAAEHVAEIGMRDASDAHIWNHTIQQQAILITKDEDFPQRSLRKPAAAPVIVWLRVGNTSRKALLQWFEPLLPEIIRAIQRGERLIEVR